MILILIADTDVYKHKADQHNDLPSYWLLVKKGFLSAHTHCKGKGVHFEVAMY